MNFEQLDLESIKFKLMSKKSGLGWSLEFCDEVEQQYKRWMSLIRKYPNMKLVPSHFVDIFWHYHILDTQKYAADCLNSFGYFIHHYPYFGMSNEEDKNKALESWDETKKLFKNEFNIELDYIEKMNSTAILSADCDDEPDCTPGACYGQDCNPPQSDCKVNCFGGDQIGNHIMNISNINKARPRPVRTMNVIN